MGFLAGVTWLLFFRSLPSGGLSCLLARPGVPLQVARGAAQHLAAVVEVVAGALAVFAVVLAVFVGDFVTRRRAEDAGSLPAVHFRAIGGALDAAVLAPSVLAVAVLVGEGVKPVAQAGVSSWVLPPAFAAVEFDAVWVRPGSGHGSQVLPSS